MKSLLSVLMLALLVSSTQALADMKASDYLFQRQAAKFDEGARERLDFYLQGLLDGIVAAEARNRQIAKPRLFCLGTEEKIGEEELIRALDATITASAKSSRYDPKKTSVSVHALVGLSRMFPCP